MERYCEEVKVQTRESDQQRSFGESSSLGGGGGGGEQMKSPLMLIESFLQALTNMDTNGRIVITRKGIAFNSSIIWHGVAIILACGDTPNIFSTDLDSWLAIT